MSKFSILHKNTWTCRLENGEARDRTINLIISWPSPPTELQPLHKFKQLSLSFFELLKCFIKCCSMLWITTNKAAGEVMVVLMMCCCFCLIWWAFLVSFTIWVSILFDYPIACIEQHKQSSCRKLTSTCYPEGMPVYFLFTFTGRSQCDGGKLKLWLFSDSVGINLHVHTSSGGILTSHCAHCDNLFSKDGAYRPWMMKNKGRIWIKRMTLKSR